MTGRTEKRLEGISLESGYTLQTRCMQVKWVAIVLSFSAHWLKEFIESIGSISLKLDLRKNESRYNIIWNGLDQFLSVPKIIVSKFYYYNQT